MRAPRHIFSSHHRKYASSRLILLLAPVLPRRFAQRMRRRMEKSSRHPVREFGPIGKVLSLDGEAAPPANPTSSVCVHLHLYYTDVAEEFAHILNRLTVEFVLLVSVSANEDEAEWQAYFQQRVRFARQVIVRRTVNKGRDVLPWVVDLATEIRKHEIFCHMHTKRSHHNTRLNGWRSFLVQRMFGSEAIVGQILCLFEANPELGLVFPPYVGGLGPRHLPPNWGDNERIATRLLARIDPALPRGPCVDFPAGSFFWARVSCLEPLFEVGLTSDDFEEEQGQLDGTLAHTIERVVGFLPELAGMQKLCVTIDTKPATATQFVPRRFLHAER